MDRALIVGGTGMLAGVARALSARGIRTAVLARRIQRAPASTLGIACDYRDIEVLVRAVRGAGPFDLAVVWIHANSPDAPLALARALAESGGPVRYVHVLGSAEADPAASDVERRSAFEALRGVTYEEVVLGFVVESGGSRWLRDEEIAEGVLRAIDRPAPRTIVGKVEPWSARP